ncbi:MAG: hypothetical protein JRI96_18035 [Deltaproteobacteria bacterium]|nr:hypothetical protein [Deltaproteobacteria bacterium]
MNFIVYFFTFQLVYVCYAVAVFGPIILLFYILQPIIPGFLSVLDTVIGIIGIPLFVLLVWFSHQTTKRIAYWHLSFTESFADTFKAFKSYIGIIFRFK